MLSNVQDLLYLHISRKGGLLPVWLISVFKIKNSVSLLRKCGLYGSMSITGLEGKGTVSTWVNIGVVEDDTLWKAALSDMPLTVLDFLPSEG